MTTTATPTRADYERLTSTWSALRDCGCPATSLAHLLDLANMDPGFASEVRRDGRFALVGLE